MMTFFFQQALANGSASTSSPAKSWLNRVASGGTLRESTANNTANRWLLPYADFLTVLFCITLLWCGLALKQAHWLQIQNGKLDQALQQANQQLIVANQTIETQRNSVKNLEKRTLLAQKPVAKAAKFLLVPLVAQSVTKQPLLGASPPKKADKIVY
jgi:hypothetical protein